MYNVMMSVQSICPAKPRGKIVWFNYVYVFQCMRLQKAKLDYILKKLGPHSSSLTIRNRPNKNGLPDKCQFTHTHRQFSV